MTVEVQPGRMVLLVCLPDGSFVELPVAKGRTVVIATANEPGALPFMLELPLVEFDRLCVSAGARRMDPIGEPS